MMKQKKTLFFLIVLFFNIGKLLSQITPCNLIQNGDFEIYSACPIGNGEMNKATPWNQGTFSAMWPSSDFFHQTCGFMNVGGGITPPLPFPSGVGCAGVYTNYGISPSNYYKEEAGQKLNFCAGQKYKLELYAAKPASGGYINIAGNLSFQIGNAAVLPTNNVNATTFCANGFTQETSITGSLITSAWQPFTRFFTASQNADAFMVTGACNGPHTVTGYVFFDKLVLTTEDTLIVTPTSISTCDSANFTITIPGCYGPYDVVINNGTTIDTLFNINSGYVNTVYPTQNTTYTITSIINSFGCPTPLNIPITVTGGTATTSTINPTICVGSSYTLPGGTVVSTSGAYHDTLGAVSGCDSIITTNLTISNFVVSTQNPAICSGNTYTLPDASIVTVAGIYADTLTAFAGCDSIITTTLTVNPAPTSNQSAAICFGASYILPGGAAASVSGIYNDTLTTIGGCDSIIITTLSVSSLITNSQTITICIGNSYILPGGATVSTAGAYIDTLNASSGCDSVLTTNLIVSSILTGSQSVTICSGNTYTLPSGVVVNSSGTYSDTLTTSGGCDSVVATTLTVNALPVVNVSPNITILEGDATTLTASGGGAYSWTPATGLNTATGASVIASPLVTTTYCVIITDVNGCIDSACVTVFVDIIPCYGVENLGIPNAFAPNADGLNDEFCLQGWDACVENFAITIYDRWGEKVFESKDPNFCWDGQYKGTIMDAQVFVYCIKAKYKNVDKAVIKKGNISLIR